MLRLLALDAVSVVSVVCMRCLLSTTYRESMIVTLCQCGLCKIRGRVRSEVFKLCVCACACGACAIIVMLFFENQQPLLL